MGCDADNPMHENKRPAGSNEEVVWELARVHRALVTLSAGNRAVLRAVDEQELLWEMCHVIVVKGGYRLACVGYAQHDQNRSIRWMASVGTDIVTLDSLHFTWAHNELGQAAIGTAIRTSHSVVGRVFTDSIYTRPSLARVRDFSLKEGFSSVTALPLSVGGTVIGALIMGAVEPDSFDEAEVKLLNELADDLAYGISNLRTRAEHRAAQATIARLAYYDSLTGLPNRTLLLEKVKDAIQTAKMQRCAVALLHLEIGRFHEINKVLGYHAGDDFVREISRRLVQTFYKDEMLARVGEAEFALMLPNSSEAAAIQVANRVSNALCEPIHIADFMLDMNINVGIALYPEHATEADTLIRRANAAMHQAKPKRGNYAMYTKGQEQEHTRRLALMGDLHRALFNNELRLYCQPKINIASRHLCGAEALVRWQHPQYGMIPTAEFIFLAEQAGSITPVTHWMLEAVFSQAYSWQASELKCPLAINLSAHDLYDTGLIERIGGLFSTYGILPTFIQFELTESALMVDPESALDSLERLKQLEVQLFIDDFGTGYSGLSYLQRLPVDAIKIDQSFVKPMALDCDSEVIVHSTIELGHNLGLKVVAEGVENEATWERLSKFGCDVAQGYLISKPMPAEQMPAWAGQWSQMLD